LFLFKKNSKIACLLSLHALLFIYKKQIITLWIFWTKLTPRTGHKSKEKTTAIPADVDPFR